MLTFGTRLLDGMIFHREVIDIAKTRFDDTLVTFVSDSEDARSLIRAWGSNSNGFLMFPHGLELPVDIHLTGVQIIQELWHPAVTRRIFVTVKSNVFDIYRHLLV